MFLASSPTRGFVFAWNTCSLYLREPVVFTADFCVDRDLFLLPDLTYTNPVHFDRWILLIINLSPKERGLF